MLFLWDNASGCLLTQGTRSICTSHQELYPTERPEFEVTCLTVNESGTRAAVWGAGGIAVMDLPWRCGPRLEYQDGKPQIITRCRTVQDVDLGYGAEVVQVRWNPFSVNDSALVVLISDNSLYHFDMMPVECSNIETLQLGSRPYSRQRTLAALGEMAVDFCFAPLFVETTKKEGATALLVLRGNGDVNMVFGGAEGEVSPEGQSLPISPLPDDNYLGDACAILAVPGKPPGVVLATTRGVLYHALLVPLDVDQVEVPPQQRRYRLLVVESVLLDLGLLSAPDDLSVFPLRLISDPSHPRRYLVVHPSGVHSVFMEILSGVEHLISYSSNESSPSQTMPQSTLEYLICTGRALLGCVAFPYTLVAIDCEYNVMAVPLRRIELPPFQLFSPEEEYQSEQGPLNRQMRQPFCQQVEQLLTESRVVPHMQLPRDELPREQLLALIVRISNLVRKVSVPRYRAVRTILNHRIQLIRTMKALQLHELARLEAERETIQSAAECFAERVQGLSDDLEDFRERVQKVVRQVAEKNPAPSDVELTMEATVGDVEAKLQDYAASLEKLKKSRAYQELKIEEQSDKREVALGNKQISTIHTCLSVIGENIGQLMRRINEMNDMLGMTTD